MAAKDKGKRDEEEFVPRGTPRQAAEPAPAPPPAPPLPITIKPQGAVPSVQWYRVEADMVFYLQGQGPSRLAKGSMVCALTHSIDTLCSQGAQLTMCDAPRPSRDAFGESR